METTEQMVIKTRDINGAIRFYNKFLDQSPIKITPYRVDYAHLQIQEISFFQDAFEPAGYQLQLKPEVFWRTFHRLNGQLMNHPGLDCSYVEGLFSVDDPDGNRWVLLNREAHIAPETIQNHMKFNFCYLMPFTTL